MFRYTYIACLVDPFPAYLISLLPVTQSWIDNCNNRTILKYFVVTFYKPSPSTTSVILWNDIKMHLSALSCFDRRYIEVYIVCVPLTTLVVFALLIQLPLRRQFWKTVLLLIVCTVRSLSSVLFVSCCGVLLSALLVSYSPIHTGCSRRNGPDFGRVFLVILYRYNPKHLCPK